MNAVSGSGRLPCSSSPKRSRARPSSSISTTKSVASPALASRSRRAVQRSITERRACRSATAMRGVASRGSIASSELAGHQALSAPIGTASSAPRSKPMRERRLRQRRPEARRHHDRRRLFAGPARRRAPASCKARLAAPRRDASPARSGRGRPARCCRSATLTSRPGRAPTDRQSGNGSASAASQAISVTSTGPSTGGSSNS